MAKRMKRVSMMLVLVLLVTIYASFTAVAEEAAELKRFDLNNGNYVTISNVIEVTKTEDVGYGETLYVVSAPAAITFHGKFSDDTAIAQWFEDDEGLNYIEIKDNKAILTEPVKYGVFPVAAGDSQTWENPILLQVVEGMTPTIETPVATESISESVSSTPTASKVVVDGKAVSFEAYNIEGNNFFKLRDLAMAVNGSDKSFEVSWDGENNAISLLSNEAYTPEGNELKASGEPTTKQAVATTAKVYLDGKELSLVAYNIDGNNYFKLRDVAQAINIGISWDADANSIGIETKNDYKE
jgi:hypothetical protein